MFNRMVDTNLVYICSKQEIYVYGVREHETLSQCMLFPDEICCLR